MSLDGRLDATTERRAVEFRFAVTNAGLEPVALSFRSGFVADVAVSDGERVVWRWSDGRSFTLALEEATLAPGESVVHEVTWPDPEPGHYAAVATLQAVGRNVEARTDVDV